MLMSGFDPWNTPWPTTPEMAEVTAKRLTQHMQGMSRLAPEYSMLVERLDQMRKQAETGRPRRDE
jgi:hypothetical protein